MTKHKLWVRIFPVKEIKITTTFAYACAKSRKNNMFFYLNVDNKGLLSYFSDVYEKNLCKFF